MSNISIFIVGILFWQLVTFILTVATDDQDKGAVCGSLVWWVIMNATGTILVKGLKIDFKEVNYKMLHRKWKRAIKRKDYNFTEFRKNNGKYWISSFNRLIKSKEFIEHENI